MCEYAVSGEEHKVHHVIERSKIGIDPVPPPEGPGLVRMAWNFAGSLVNHVVHGMHHASDEVKEERLTICRQNTCGYFGEGDRCLHTGCGCFLQVKADWSESSCPISLWEAVEVKDE
jgi:hypothetical protein